MVVFPTAAREVGRRRTGDKGRKLCRNATSPWLGGTNRVLYGRPELSSLYKPSHPGKVSESKRMQVLLSSSGQDALFEVVEDGP